MKLRIRIVGAIITSPVWLMVGVFTALVFIPLTIALTITSVIEFAFSGEWDPWWN